MSLGLLFSDGAGRSQWKDGWYLECLPQLEPQLLLGTWFYGVCMGWICLQLRIEHIGWLQNFAAIKHWNRSETWMSGESGRPPLSQVWGNECCWLKVVQPCGSGKPIKCCPQEERHFIGGMFAESGLAVSIFQVIWVTIACMDILQMPVSWVFMGRPKV